MPGTALRRVLYSGVAAGVLVAGGMLLWWQAPRSGSLGGAGPAEGTASSEKGVIHEAAMEKSGAADRWAGAEGKQAGGGAEREEEEALAGRWFADWGPEPGEEWLEIETLPGDLLSPPIPLKFEASIWLGYRRVTADPKADVAALGLRMLAATSAAVRITGAIWLLEKNGRLHPSLLDQLIADEAAAVPLTVLGWMLDSGLDPQAREFDARWKGAAADAREAAIQALFEEPLNGMGGRAALWLAEQSGRPEAELRELVLRVLRDETAEYDVRWKAAMLLRGRMDFADYQSVIEELAPAYPEGVPEGGEGSEFHPPPPFATAMGILHERLEGPPEAMEQAPVLTPEGAELFFADPSGLMLENVALWVEAAVERRDLPVQTGFTASLERQLERLPEGELPANQALALRRLRARLGELRRLEIPGPRE